MSCIFISYRSQDYDDGVSVLYGHLIDLFGEENVVLDKSSFAPGSAWLPQIRTKVAMSDIVLCAIGASWTTEKRSSHEGEIDYVVEELTLARKLRKQVIPVTLGVDPNLIRSSLPSAITWLADIQFFRFDPKTTGAGADIGNFIVGLGGPKMLGVTAAQQTLVTRANFSVLRVLRAALGSIFRPTTYAASAMQPTLTSLQNSSLRAIISVALLSLVAILIVGELSFYMTAKFTANLSVLALLTFAVFTFLGKFADSRPSVLSTASFSIHFSAALHTALAIWALLFWVVLPDSVHERFTAMATSEIPAPQQIESMFEDLTTAAVWSLGVIQWGAIIHLVLLVFGISRAGVLVLGWKRWKLLLPLSALSFALIALLFLLLSSSDGVRRGNLPQKVKLSWLKDEVTTEGTRKVPFLFEVNGTIEKRNNSISFLVDRFRAENRAQPAMEIRALMCALRTLRSGKFEWPEVMHEGRASIMHQLMPNQSMVRENMTVEIPLGSQFRSGETSISCFVEVPTGSYPIGDGTLNLLRW